MSPPQAPGSHHRQQPQQQHHSLLHRLTRIPQLLSRATLTLSLLLLLVLPAWVTGVSASAQSSAAIRDNKHLIGVQPDRRNLYSLTGATFKCLDGSETIPFESVNDNYCDCRDASDEPGTSACPHGQFFCANIGYLQTLIPSYYVNDGQCDCCDASDEYESQANCTNTCGTLGELYRAEQEKHKQIYDQGSAIRSQYKQEAEQRREQNAQLLDQYKRELSEKENAIKKIEEEMSADFGPDGIYSVLKGKCFKFTDREYTYTLCPFERATQESNTGMNTELGRWSGWAGPADNLYSIMRYDGGIQCWNGPARSALVQISCGVEDKIVSVVEPSKCEYVYSFITPAACPDLDPPKPVEPEPESESASEQDHQATTAEPDSEESNLEMEDSLDSDSDEHEGLEAPELAKDIKHEEL